MSQTGIVNEITLGRNNVFMMLPEEMFSFIHNIMVVTSPIGVQAPPALAAMIIMLPKIQRSFVTVSNF